MNSTPVQSANWIIRIYAACFCLGALSHARDFWVYGPFPYAAAPSFIELFWSCLIVIDALLVLILLSRYSYAGCWLALVLMSVDVAINTYALIWLDFENLAIPLVLQSIFLGFILGSIWFVPRGRLP